MHRPSFMPISLFFILACADQAAAPTGDTPGSSPSLRQNGIVHRVSAGGPDMCVWLGEKPGCDGNYSLIAIEREDGSVTGQLSDQYGEPGGLHAVVDCLLVQVIPGRTTLEAWVGAVATHPAPQAGRRVLTRLRDNGTSANDFPDAIGRAIVDPQREGYSPDCHDRAPMGLGRVSQGEVRIE